MHRRHATVLALALAASPASAYEPERAMENLASDFSTCAAYLLVAAKAMEGQDEETSAAYTYEAGRFIALSNEATNEEVAAARIEVAATEMMEEIDNDASNLMILFAKHGKLCQEIAADIQGRFDYWLDKKD